MAWYDTTWYCNAGDQSTTGYYAVTKRPQNTAVTVGTLRRQFTTPSVGNERVFVCIVAGTTANTTDATWTLSRGAIVTDGTVQWLECTGIAAFNGDNTNTPTWSQVKAIGSNVSVGVVIKRNNGVSYQICNSTGNTGGSEPAFSDTAGTVTNDSLASWVSLGPVGNFTTGGAAPFARLASVCTTNWLVGGNTVYVGDNHAELQSTGITITVPGGTGVITKFICHNRSGSYPPTTGNLMTGATISITTNVSLIVTASASAYFYGLTFMATGPAGSGQMISLTNGGAGGNGGAWTYYENCSFQILNTSGSAMSLGIASTGQANVFNNCKVKFANSVSSINLGYGPISWTNSAPFFETGSIIPATLFSSLGSIVANTVVLEANDFSLVTGNLVGNATIGYVGNVIVKDCKLAATTTISTPVLSGLTVQLVRSSA